LERAGELRICLNSPLDSDGTQAKIQPICSARTRLPRAGAMGRMSSAQPQKPPVNTPNGKAPVPCKHPQVQIVARDEDSEFVECKECGEVFEASEFKDMAIEDNLLDDEE
jgi:hypothetical protein